MGGRNIEFHRTSPFEYSYNLLVMVFKNVLVSMLSTCKKNLSQSAWSRFFRKVYLPCCNDISTTSGFLEFCTKNRWFWFLLNVCLIVKLHYTEINISDKFHCIETRFSFFLLYGILGKKILTKVLIKQIYSYYRFSRHVFGAKSFVKCFVFIIFLQHCSYTLTELGLWKPDLNKFCHRRKTSMGDG